MWWFFWPQFKQPLDLSAHPAAGPRRPTRWGRELLRVFEETEGRAALQFGQAVRGGDVGGVRQFVDQKGPAAALRVKFSFEVMVQRMVVYRAEEGCLPPAMESVTIQVRVTTMVIVARYRLSIYKWPSHAQHL